MKTIPYSKFKHGQRVTCEVEGVKVEGKIGIDDDGYIYLCSDYNPEGSDDFRAFGYRSSYSFLRKNENYFYNETQYIEQIQFLPRTLDDLEEGDVIVDKRGNERSVLGRCGSICFLSYVSEQDVYSYTTTILDIKRLYTLKQEDPEEEITELTLEDIAKLANVPVEKLRIKD